jgi:hypothetical protein
MIGIIAYNFMPAKVQAVGIPDHPLTAPRIEIRDGNGCQRVGSQERAIETQMQLNRLVGLGD